MKAIPKIQKVLWVVLLLGIGGLVYSVLRALDAARKSPAGDDEAASSFSIYIPSPVERAAMQRLPSLWPETFHAQRPLTASKLPLFYNKLFSDPRRSQLELSATQFAVARHWSMDANMASLDSLKESLAVPVEEYFGSVDQAPSSKKANLEPTTLAGLLKQSSSKGEGECSLFRLERLFRIAQAWPQFQKDVAARYRSCVGPDDLLSVWFDLNQLLFSDSAQNADPALRESVGKRLTELHQKGSPVDAHLAERLSHAAFLKSTH